MQVDLCGHATLASAHVIFSNSLVDSEVVEFATRSGILTAKRVPLTEEESTFLIELDFPVVPTCEVNSTTDLSVFSNAVNGATIVDIKATEKDVLVRTSQQLSPLVIVAPSLEPNLVVLLSGCAFVVGVCY